MTKPIIGLVGLALGVLGLGAAVVGSATSRRQVENLGTWVGLGGGLLLAWGFGGT